MNIGLKIKQLCERDNISLAELARRLGRTRPAIYEMVEKEDVTIVMTTHDIGLMSAGTLSYELEDGAVKTDAVQE